MGPYYNEKELRKQSVYTIHPGKQLHRLNPKSLYGDDQEVIEKLKRAVSGAHELSFQLSNNLKVQKYQTF